jgi:galactokinase
MDQYSVAVGNIIYLESEPTLSIQTLNPNLGAFVLGDSCEPKDTMGILSRCRDSRLDIIRKLKVKNPNESVHNLGENADLFDLNGEEKKIIHGTIQNRDLLKKALIELEKDETNHELIGALLTEHHTVLRDVLKVSTPKIESMLDAALDAGALGGKINGSGGGGSMFAYAPNNSEAIAEAIEKSGGKSYIVRADEGTIIN